MLLSICCCWSIKWNLCKHQQFFIPKKFNIELYSVSCVVWLKFKHKFDRIILSPSLYYFVFTEKRNENNCFNRKNCLLKVLSTYWSDWHLGMWIYDNFLLGRIIDCCRHKELIIYFKIWETIGKWQWKQTLLTLMFRYSEEFCSW